jgi:cell division septum initiation protein DivIVA
LRDGGELAQRLAHEARLQAHVRVAHVALDLGLGVSAATESTTIRSIGAGAHQRVRDLERLLAAVRLADQQLLESTPSLRAYSVSSACSASMKAQTPPARCASRWRAA